MALILVEPEIVYYISVEKIDRNYYCDLTPLLEYSKRTIDGARRILLDHPMIVGRVDRYRGSCVDDSADSRALREALDLLADTDTLFWFDQDKLIVQLGYLPIVCQVLKIYIPTGEQMTDLVQAAKDLIIPFQCSDYFFEYILRIEKRQRAAMNLAVALKTIKGPLAKIVEIVERLATINYDITIHVKARAKTEISSLTKRFLAASDRHARRVSR